MDNHTVQFLFIRYSQALSIRTHGVKADEQIAGKTAAMESEFAAEAENLRQIAEHRLKDTAAIVVERIVGG